MFSSNRTLVCLLPVCENAPKGSVHKLLKGLSLLCLTAVTSLLEKDEVDPNQIGRLEVGILSKSIVLFTFSST
nr:hydroxymethylglutaryl-CoA synthase [Ipomoea trifida]GLL31514.1 hydroxymethylglutaryl-CoA synthase [Ipomoea trifida]GLL34488.1 hydroxymethylglutaryl-CoA synthase [Ipomoea trifida]